MDDSEEDEFDPTDSDDIEDYNSFDGSDNEDSWCVPNDNDEGIIYLKIFCLSNNILIFGLQLKLKLKR